MSIDRTQYQKDSSIPQGHIKHSSKKYVPPFKERRSYKDESLDSYSTVLKCIKGKFFSEEFFHFMKRRSERSITLAEVRQVLTNGRLQDMQWKDYRQTWYYKFSGETALGRDLSVVVHLNRRRNALCYVSAIDNGFISRRKSEETRESKRESIKFEKEVSEPRRFSLDSYLKPAVKTRSNATGRDFHLT